ncbi:MAG: YbeD family protein [Thermodesulfobacteriota bacterium]
MERVVWNTTKEKLALEYPCRWVYKLIGPCQREVKAAIVAVLQERECLVTLSNSSRTGKYHCLDVEVVVHSEDDRTANYEAFKRHPAIVMVL